MWFSNQTMGNGNGMIPGEIDGVFYAPNYAFEHTIGATLTKIAKGEEMNRGYIDIKTSGYTWGQGATTVAVRRWDGDCECYKEDGEDGIGSCGGIRYRSCGTCGGDGRTN